jgi:hypothetical protein
MYSKLPYIGISCKYGTRTIYSDSIFCLALIAEDLQRGPVITKKDSRFSCYFFNGVDEFVEGTAAPENHQTVMNTAFMAPQKLFRAIRRVEVVSTPYSSFKTSIFPSTKSIQTAASQGIK